ncbi:MAG: GNAT family N-acetyltransferase [Tuberibacillus sp.]
MKVIFKLMNQKDAESISKWRYDERYVFYNVEKNAGNLEDLLDPKRRGYHYYSAYKDGRLVGFFSFHYDRETRITRMGLGLHPELTGKGLGSTFVKQGLAFGMKNFPGTSVFQLFVSAFNKRAIKVYKKFGFQPNGEMLVETDGGVFRFLHMEMDTAA